MCCLDSIRKIPYRKQYTITVDSTSLHISYTSIFALSGYFFKPMLDLKDFWQYAKKKTIIFGLPYIFYSIIHFCLQKIAGATVRIPTTIFALINIYKNPLGVSWYLYILWSILIIYGLVSILVKNRRMLFLISIFAYCLTLFVQTDIYIIQKTLV